MFELVILIFMSLLCIASYCVGCRIGASSMVNTNSLNGTVKTAVGVCVIDKNICLATNAEHFQFLVENRKVDAFSELIDVIKEKVTYDIKANHLGNVEVRAILNVYIPREKK